MIFLRPRAITVRGRLIRRFIYRAWKSFAVWRAQHLIRKVEYERSEETALALPTIILSTYTRIEDFLVLTYLFKEHELTFLAPARLPNNKLIARLKAFHQTLDLGPKGVDFVFLRRMISALRIYNRSVVISPGAAAQFMDHFSLDYSNLARIAMKANAPIQPVVIRWDAPASGAPNAHQRKCSVFIGKRIFISPRHPDFHDIFFRKRGTRKFTKLSREELKEVGGRLLNRFNQMREQYGANLSEKVGTGSI